MYGPDFPSVVNSAADFGCPQNGCSVGRIGVISSGNRPLWCTANSAAVKNIGPGPVIISEIVCSSVSKPVNIGALRKKRTLFLKSGFHIRQVYHRGVYLHLAEVRVYSSIQRQAAPQTGTQIEAGTGCVPVTGIKRIIRIMPCIFSLTGYIRQKFKVHARLNAIQPCK